MNVNESAENYLETILILSKSKPVVRSVDIAEELGFKKSSVSVAMKNLREKNHITVTKEGFIYLTNSGKEIADEEIFSICNQELAALKELGILSESVKEVDPSSYSAVLYSAIDVLEPQNNMAVWRVSLSTSHQNADKANRLIDAYIDADSGKIYSFYARTDTLWSQMDPEEMMDAWGGYLGLTGREAYDSDNPLMETTPDFVKYRFPGMEERSTIVTIGFYEGINELFIKLT